MDIANNEKLSYDTINLRTFFVCVVGYIIDTPQMDGICKEKLVYSSVVTQIEMDGQENQSRQNKKRVPREGCGNRDNYRDLNWKIGK